VKGARPGDFNNLSKLCFMKSCVHVVGESLSFLTACILQHHLDRAASSLSLMGAAPYLVLLAHQRGGHDQGHAQMPGAAQKHAQIR